MISTTRTFISLAALSLIVASLIHLEVVIDGYGHREAGIAEAVIAVVMLIGLAFTWLPGRRGRQAGVASLGFGLIGALVGLFTIMIGVGPQTTPDVIYHATLTVVLVVGLIVAGRGLAGERHRGRHSNPETAGR